MKIIQILFLQLIPFSLLAQVQDSIPVYSTFTVDSKYTSETRVINVWLPPDYTNNDKTYPVLYMPDGGIKEDFPHIANTLADLIKNHKIAPIILVGIENTVRRRDLTGFTEVASDKKIAPVFGGSDNFRAFIREELFPEVEKRYRTSGYKGIIGESLAGLFVTETLLLQPDMFDFYISMDPSLWWNNHHLVQQAPSYLSHFRDKKIKFWFAGSNAKDISKHTKSLSKILQKHPVPGLTWYYADEPKEKHHTIFRATKEKALLHVLASDN